MSSYEEYAKDKKYIATVNPLLRQYISSIPDISCDIGTLSSLIIMTPDDNEKGYYDVQNMFSQRRGKSKILQDGVICMDWHKSAPYGFAMIATDRNTRDKYILTTISTKPRIIFWKGDMRILFFGMISKQYEDKRIEDMVECGLIKDLFGFYKNHVFFMRFDRC